MQQRHPRSGASGGAPASKTLKGPAKGTIPWPSESRRSIPPPPAPTLKQPFGVQQEEDAPTRIHVRGSQYDSRFPDQVEPVTPVPARRPRTADKRASSDATRSWAPVEGRAGPNLWDEPCTEQSATSNVTQGQLEELRKHLQLEQEKFSKASRARAPGLDSTPQMGHETVPIRLPSRGRRLALWLAPVAIVTVLGLGVVAHQTGYRPQVDVSQLDMSRLNLSSLKLSSLELPQVELPQVDVRPLQSAMSKAQAGLSAGYDELFGGKSPSRPASALPPAPASALPPAPAPQPESPSAEAPVPTVVQLQEGDLPQQVDEALLSPTSASSEAIPQSTSEDMESVATELSALMDEGSKQAANEPANAEPEMPAVEKTVEKKNARPAMRVARAPRAKGKGVLRINSLPWAEIYVDGELVGHTPSMNLELSAGRHRIGLTNKDHGLSNSFVVDIKPGGVETRIVNLKDPSKS